ncbi:MAG: TetR/AcrR family transcriptional regulator [Deltaproteobacteria bacterium]|nr:TetR/AcrR family transcriptional regulator [Candidatus Zymogenaceae bacterium]
MTQSKNLELTQKRKSQILRAAYDIIAEQGYENITVQDIATRAGFSKGIIYYYFSSKEDVMVSLFDSIIRVIDRNFASTIQNHPEPKEQMERILRVSFDLVHEHKEFYHVMMVFWSQITQKTLMSDLNATLFRRYRREMAKIVERGVDKGVFRARVDVNLLASLIIAVIGGASLQYIFDPEAFDFKVMVDTSVAAVMSFLNA